MGQTVTIGIAGAVSSVAYIVMTVRMSFLEFFPGPGITVDFPKMLGPDWKANTIFLVGWSVVLFAAYGGAVAASHGARNRSAVGLLAGFPVAFVAVLTFMYPPQSVDFIHNVADARTLFLFGDNPMVVPPDANSFPVGQSYGGEPAPYGPLWFLLQFPVLLAGEELQPELHLLKLWTSLFYLASAFLVFRIVRRITPGREPLALTLYAWNPFVVMRVAGNGHNDAAMMFFVLLALWAFVERDHAKWVLPALAAGVLAKYSAALLVPPVLLAMSRRQDGPHTMAIGAALGITLAVVVFAPLWAGADTFDVVRQQAGKFITSTPHVLREWLSLAHAMEPARADEVARTITTAAFLAVYVALLVHGWRARFKPEALIACCALAFLAFNLLAVTWFRPWYMLWVVTLLVLVPGRHAIVLVVAISAGGMLPDIVEQYRTNIGFFRQHYLWAIAAPVVVAFAPPTIAWLVGTAKARTPLLV